MEQMDRITRRYNRAPVGPKGLTTMNRMLDALAEEIAEVDWHQVSVPRMARRGDFSPPNFYQYYKTVEQAVVDLYYRESDAHRVTQHLRAIATLMFYEHPELFDDTTTDR